MKNKIFLICIMIFSLSVLSSCSDKKLDAETQGVVDAIVAEKWKGVTEENVICWVTETKKLLNDDQWQYMRFQYDPNVKGKFDMEKMMNMLGLQYAAANTCKVKLPA